MVMVELVFSLLEQVGETEQNSSTFHSPESKNH